MASNNTAEVVLNIENHTHPSSSLQSMYVVVKPVENCIHLLTLTLMTTAMHFQ